MRTRVGCATGIGSPVAVAAFADLRRRLGRVFQEDEEVTWLLRQVSGQLSLRRVDHFAVPVTPWAQIPASVGGEDRRMDVALLADRRCVPQRIGNPGYGADDFLLAILAFRARLTLAQEADGQDGTGPGPEILGAEILAGDLSKVGVDVIRFDAPRLPVLVQVLKQLLAGEILAALDDAGQAAVGEADRMSPSTLTSELEADGRPVDVRVPAAQRCETEGTVLLAVFLVADPDARLLEEADDRGQDLRPGDARPAKVLLGAGANARQGLTELQQAIELRGVTNRPPAGVVAVLLATPRVPAGGLEMTHRIGADPDVGPGGRNDQAADAAEHFLGLDRGPIGSDVPEPFAGTQPPDPGQRVRHVMELGGAGGDKGVVEIDQVGDRRSGRLRHRDIHVRSQPASRFPSCVPRFMILTISLT